MSLPFLVTTDSDLYHPINSITYPNPLTLIRNPIPKMQAYRPRHQIPNRPRQRQQIRGPKTPAGKSRAARNSVRHGLLTRNLLIDRDSADRFHELVNNLYDEFQPQTHAERAAVDTMAWARWRQMRMWTLERSLVDAEIHKLNTAHATTAAVSSVPGNDGCNRAALAFRNLTDHSAALNVLNRYEGSFDRQFSRALRRLVTIREAAALLKKSKFPNERAPLQRRTPAGGSPAPGITWYARVADKRIGLVTSRFGALCQSPR